ncbi:MAG: nuclear transport factor 2 family protein [Alphaproteobacteria bacterium]|nr:nuclear transport factor 2 family protein [Alphaproteobacteria bacterium]MDE2013702.1 nuclear transport factor 2 family protein [Alphaproteobacteria bacterium]MDE2073252.1 nuclear transport factor 2 family protein [Alphaproteobacteria bacterium]
MSPADNKRMLQNVFSETAKGNGRPFVDMLADGIRWTIIGTTAWSRTYEGKEAVLKDLLAPLNANFAGPNVVTAERFIAEGDVVVVEGRNHSTTKAGPPYPNRYCWVFVLREGKAHEITEYTDTDLINRVLVYS